MHHLDRRELTVSELSVQGSRHHGARCHLEGSPGLPWALLLLGSSVVSWALLWSPVVSSALLDSPGLSWGLLGTIGLSWALLGSPGLS